MLRAAAFVALAAIPTFTLLQSVHSAPSTTPAPCSRVFPQEPVVVYDVTGFTLAGPLHIHLAVYSNGLASISSAGGFQEGRGQARVTTASPESVNALQQALAAAGAMQLCDNPAQTFDVPLQTVTAFAGSQQNTFSFLDASGAYGDVQTALQAFIAQTFPGF
ncbi:MAG TPA: hypothetical protein VKE69_11445 [Planctomycetota bacterium]|nr:hypothetical protein [Planctomycetota bacterium]